MRRKLRVGLDCDEVLAMCNAPALERLNDEIGSSYTIYDVDGWAASDEKLEERNKYFSDEEFVANQPVVEGARSFVTSLIDRGCEIFVITAVPGNVTKARHEWLTRNFPEVPDENIIFGKRKDIMNVDVLVDDAAHNILSSNAPFPILLRKPWNKNVTGCLAANNFEDVLALIDMIMMRNNFEVHTGVSSHTNFICLIGPSGAGKTEIIEELAKRDVNVPKVYTTSTRGTRYKTIDKETFETMIEEGVFGETTSYAGNYYGIKKEHLDAIVAENRVVVIPTDACGATTLLRTYGTRTKIIYVNRPKKMLVTDILRKDIAEDEKVMRIMALDTESRNRDLFDYYFDNINSVETAKRIYELCCPKKNRKIKSK